MRRRALATLALAALALTSGCAGLFGSGSVPDDQLDAEPEAPYAWNASADAHITITEQATFRAVYRLNDTSVDLYRRDGFGGRNAIPVRALRYRYPNGTVLNGSAFADRGGGVERTRDEVTVTVPTDGPGEGQLAFASESTPKRFSLPTFVEGAYEVVLPRDRSVDFFLFGSVSPGGFQTDDVDGRTHIQWTEPVTSRSVVVQYYLERDLDIFAVLLSVLVLVGAVGALYYRRRIAELRRRREEMGLDTDYDDEFDRGPPPGMG